MRWQPWAIAGAVFSVLALIGMTWGTYIAAGTSSEQEHWKRFSWVLVTIAAGQFIAAAWLAPWTAS